MIEFVIRREDGHEDLLCPALVCDACRKQVAGPGCILHTIRYGDPHQASPIFVAHKGRCERAVTAWMLTAYRPEDGWSRSLWREASEFMRQMAHNFANAFSADPAGEYLDQDLVLPAKSPVRDH